MLGLQGMEVYSTVLWHLKREVELAHLAQEATAWDRRSPHAWTICGNCFSLQKVKGATAAPHLAGSDPDHCRVRPVAQKCGGLTCPNMDGQLLPFTF